MEQLGHLEWTPGLVAASRIGRKTLKLDNLDYREIEVKENSKWGQPGQITTGIVYYGDNTPMNTVAHMLIDDTSFALLNTAVTQIGLDMEGDLAVVLLDRNFESSQEYAGCTPPVAPIKLMSCGDK